MAFGSAAAGYPLAASASLYFASSHPCSSTSPILVTTVWPSTGGSDSNESPDLVRKSLARSQSEYFVLAVGKMWKLQSVAATEIGVLAWNCSNAGLT